MTDQTPEQIAAMLQAECDQSRHTCETQRVAIELLNAKLGEKPRGADGFGSTDMGVKVEYRSVTLQGVFDHEPGCKAPDYSACTCYEIIRAERDQLAAEVVRLKSWRDETFTDERPSVRLAQLGASFDH